MIFRDNIQICFAKKLKLELLRQHLLDNNSNFGKNSIILSLEID